MMGDPRRPRKKYATPNHPWKKDRIEYEKNLQRIYGLKNKREIWKVHAELRRMRTLARNLIAATGEEAKKRERELMGRAYRYGLVEKDATLDDILALKPENFLDRRLQTIVYKKGLAKSIRQARQMIVHGHIMVNGTRVTAPSYFVKRDEDKIVDFYPTSPFSNPNHPERQGVATVDTTSGPPSPSEENTATDAEKTEAQAEVNTE